MSINVITVFEYYNHADSREYLFSYLSRFFCITYYKFQNFYFGTRNGFLKIPMLSFKYLDF